MEKGAAGIILKVLNGKDYILKVVEKKNISVNYLNIKFESDLIGKESIFPTKWLRLWIPENKRLIQKGYTVINSSESTFEIEFYLHDGLASTWAKNCKIGDILNATSMGSKFIFDESKFAKIIVFADMASFPAVKSIYENLKDKSKMDVYFNLQDGINKKIVQKIISNNITFFRHNSCEMHDFYSSIAENSNLISNNYFYWGGIDTKNTRFLKKKLNEKIKLTKTNSDFTGYWINK